MLFIKITPESREHSSRVGGWGCENRIQLRGYCHNLDEDAGLSDGAVYHEHLESRGLGLYNFLSFLNILQA